MKDFPKGGTIQSATSGLATDANRIVDSMLRYNSHMEAQLGRRGDEAVADGFSQATAPGLFPQPFHEMSQASTVVQVRQINVIIGSDPSATISSLSSALVTAQASISNLAQQNQQLQLSSVSAMASASAAVQASAQDSAEAVASTSASVVVASISSSAAIATAAAALYASSSSSAAVALTSASKAVAEASAMALDASRSADAARADASLVRVSLSKWCVGGVGGWCAERLNPGSAGIWRPSDQGNGGGLLDDATYHCHCDIGCGYFGPLSCGVHDCVQGQTVKDTSEDRAGEIRHATIRVQQQQCRQQRRCVLWGQEGRRAASGNYGAAASCSDEAGRRG